MDFAQRILKTSRQDLTISLSREINAIADNLAKEKVGKVKAGTPQENYYNLWNCIYKAYMKFSLIKRGEELEDYPQYNKELIDFIKEVQNPYNKDTQEEDYLQFESDKELCENLGKSIINNLCYLTFNTDEEEWRYFTTGIIQQPKDDNLRIRTLEATPMGCELPYKLLTLFEMLNFFEAWHIVDRFFNIVEQGQKNPVLLAELTIAMNYEYNLLTEEEEDYKAVGLLEFIDLYKIYKSIQYLYYDLYYLAKAIGFSIFNQKQTTTYFQIVD